MNLYHLRAHVLTENERSSTNGKTELGDLGIPGDHILNCMLPQPGSQQLPDGDDYLSCNIEEW